MKDIMVDIETLGTDTNSVIVSISAVAFDLANGKIGSSFEIGIDILEQALSGGIIDNSAIAWWYTQSKEAKEALTRIESHSVGKSLDAFNKWITKNSLVNLKDVKLWGNGSGFDNVLIRNLYRRHDIDFVLPYWCDNDVRTLVTLANIDTRNYKFDGTKHNGIDDCLHQIKYCTDAYRSLK